MVVIIVWTIFGVLFYKYVSLKARIADTNSQSLDQRLNEINHKLVY